LEQEIISIELKNKVLNLRVIPFDSDIDIQDILRIDYSNLVAEILSFSVIYNRVMNLKAEVNHLLSSTKFELDILEADLKDEHRGKISDKKGKNATVDEVNVETLKDPRYQKKFKELMNRQKDVDYIDSFYWGCQSKNAKLDILSRNVTPEEFEKEIVEGKINSVMINTKKKVINS